MYEYQTEREMNAMNEIENLMNEIDPVGFQESETLATEGMNFCDAMEEKSLCDNLSSK